MFEDLGSLADRVLYRNHFRRAWPVGIQLHSFLAHSGVTAMHGRLSSEVCCSGAASEMLPGNDILRLENYYLHTEATRTGDRPAVKGPSLVRFAKPQETTWSLGLFLRRAIFVSPAHFLSISSMMKAASRILR